MEITSTLAAKLISVALSLAKDSPLKKISKNELEAAIRELNNLCYDTSKRECLNRALGHLESAFSQFEPSTWNFLDDEDRVLWDQRTYKNNLCITIAVIHYILGNTTRAKIWLTEDLSEYGWVFMSNETLNLLGMEKTEDFFNAIYKDDGEYYRNLEWSIKEHNNQAYDDYGYNPLDPEQNPYPFF